MGKGDGRTFAIPDESGNGKSPWTDASVLQKRKFRREAKNRRVRDRSNN